MKQRQRRKLGVRAASIPMLALREFLPCLQAADADAFVKIESRPPSLLESVLKAAPEIPVLPQHPRSVVPQAPCQHVGCRLRCLIKSGDDVNRVGSALDRVSNELVERSVMACPAPISVGWPAASRPREVRWLRCSASLRCVPRRLTMVRDFASGR